MDRVNGKTASILISGMGIVSPLGNDTASHWSAIAAGRCGIGPIDLFDTSRHRTQLGAQVRGYEPQLTAAMRALRHLSRADHFALIAAAEALESAGSPQHHYPADRLAVVVGAGVGGMLLTERFTADYTRSGQANPLDLLPYPPNYTCDVLADFFHLRGERATFATACSSSSMAIGWGFDLVRTGRADCALVGGSDTLCELTYAGFNSLRSVDPEPCRPFDAKRNGLSLGEGAGFLLLERAENAHARGLNPDLAMLGYAIRTECHHMTAPEPTGQGAAAVMAAALRNCGLAPADIGYINAHGTATPQNDAAEAAAILRLFSENAATLPPVSSTKSQIGHALGAAGALEAVTTLCALRHQVLPPTVHHEQTDPQCLLDVVPNRARPASFHIALSNSFAFGGNNCTLVFARCGV
ncbi:MAG: beta-ketoacyl-[acyl-carrier-protein] synthase family protein [Candidatus Sumerlaeia bacterium]|nr:beta-ketoacyl-[acyl-carrier-protein] synthase family protein [Candidatus Sumerlaeia bacterium]